METVKTGFILYTINYNECVSFYKDVLALPVLYKKDELTCFEFFGSYLMVEVDDETDLTSPEIPVRDRTCVRLNVTDVKVACQKLDEQNIPYSYSKHSWGEIAKFRDPDGNLIGFRSAQEHETDTVVE